MLYEDSMFLRDVGGCCAVADKPRSNERGKDLRAHCRLRHAAPGPRTVSFTAHSDFSDWISPRMELSPLSAVCKDPASRPPIMPGFGLAGREGSNLWLKPVKLFPAVSLSSLLAS